MKMMRYIVIAIYIKCDQIVNVAYDNETDSLEYAHVCVEEVWKFDLETYIGS